MPELKPPTPDAFPGAEAKQLNDTQYILKDLIQGDTSVLANLKDVDTAKIQKALEFLLKNESLSGEQQLALLQDSWRVNYRAKPPTPEEFITKAYLGPAADSTFPWVKRTFLEFMDPTKPYRNLILYPHIGWGKDQPLDSRVYLTRTRWKRMGDVSVGDRVLCPDGSKAMVVGTMDWPMNDVYELTMEDGRSFRCGPHHLQTVRMGDDPDWTTIETEFIIEDPDRSYEFMCTSVGTERLVPETVRLKGIRHVSKEPTRCISIDSPDGLYVTDGGIATHNSYLSAIITLYIATCLNLMRDPWRFFGLNPATQLSQLLISYSLKKSSELLLEPFLSLLEASPFFERCQRKSQMQEAEAEFKEKDTVDRLYWTTAYETSALGFSSGSTIKIASSPNGLLGLSIVSIAYSELAFFTDAGKALALDEPVRMAGGALKAVGDLIPGERILHPALGETEVERIMWEGEDDLYEIETDDGRTVRCNARHLWPVEFDLDGVHYDTTVETRFMIDHQDIEFTLKSV